MKEAIEELVRHMVVVDAKLAARALRLNNEVLLADRLEASLRAFEEFCLAAAEKTK